MKASIPIVDVAPLLAGDPHAVAPKIRDACREFGFFCIAGHGVDPDLARELERLSRAFFAQDHEAKMAIRMARGGRAWRGYFPVGGEYTLDRPDCKEGLYFGAELGTDHPRVRARVLMHGANLFPDIPGFRETVLAWIDSMTALGHRLMAGLAASLGLPPDWFDEHYTRDPLVLFRVFHYPPVAEPDAWSVGEHTDYGFLTILRQDDVGGLQVRCGGGWIDVAPMEDTFVCNIGDMLDRLTAGEYRSTPHRVRNVGARGRLSFPFFFDPDFDADIRPLDPNAEVDDDRDTRWDRSSVHDLHGTYGEYILAKVARVFPDLGSEIAG